MPGLLQGNGAPPEQLTRWIEGHYAFCRHMFSGAPNFLAFSVEDADASDKISAFIGLEIKWWGMSNRNRAVPEPAVEECK